MAAADLASDHDHIVVERWRAAAAQLGAPAIHAQLSFHCNALFFVSERAVAAERYEQIGTLDCGQMIRLPIEMGLETTITEQYPAFRIEVSVAGRDRKRPDIERAPIEGGLQHTIVQEHAVLDLLDAHLLSVDAPAQIGLGDGAIAADRYRQSSVRDHRFAEHRHERLDRDDLCLCGERQRCARRNAPSSVALREPRLRTRIQPPQSLTFRAQLRR